MRLHQRHHIDIGWADLAFAALAALRSGRPDAAGAVSRHWPPDVSALPCLSVRTAFDALLSSLQLQPGAEIIMSGINIEGMAEIAAAHGLAVRAVDIDPATLAPSPADVATAVSQATRLILIAHLFGSRIDLAPFAALRSARVLLVEDCAQAWTPEFRGSPEADVSLFSFGPIKTITALGGAVAVVRRPDIASGLAERLAALPPLGKGWFLKRIAKFAALKAASHPLPYGMIHRAFGFLGLDFEEKMGAMARGFGKGGLLGKIRRRPPDALLRLLDRRLSAPSDIALRKARSEALMKALPASFAPGATARNHAYWLTPVLVADPEAARTALLAQGFDATRGTTSIRALGGSPEATPLAAAMLRQVLYLPSPAALPPGKHAELARLVAAIPPYAPAESRRPSAR